MTRLTPSTAFGPVEAVVGWVVALGLSIVGAVTVATIAGYGDKKSSEIPIGVTLVGIVVLWCALMAVMIAIVRWFGSGSIRADLGFAVRPSDVVLGGAVGAIAQLVFIPLLYRLLDAIGLVNFDQVDDAAKELTGKASGFTVVLLVAAVTVGAPIVEELFYRGLVLRAFQARISDALAIVISASMFAFAHFQPVQFAGLLLVGVVFGYLSYRTRRLGPSIFAHAAFNLVTVIDVLT
jgi:uncharacterized protein